MKKIFLTICVVFACLSVSAQKGEHNIGVQALYGTDASNFGIGVKYQYNILDDIRLEAVGDYYFKSDGFSMFDININGHYLFHFSKFTLYPLVGINFTHWKQENVFDMLEGYDGSYTDEFEVDSKDSSIGLNIGGGVQYNLTDKFRIGFEVKYQTISGASTAIIGLGVTYTL